MFPDAKDTKVLSDIENGGSKEETFRVAVSMPLRLPRNIDKERGLVNGALCSVKHIISQSPP
eukprot:6354745-Karenia_brevis.AAC.1